MLVTSIFSFFPKCFLPFQKLISIFESRLSCRLQVLSIWTGLKFCRLVKSWYLFCRSRPCIHFAETEEEDLTAHTLSLVLPFTLRCFINYIYLSPKLLPEPLHPLKSPYVVVINFSSKGEALILLIKPMIQVPYKHAFTGDNRALTV